MRIVYDINLGQIIQSTSYVLPASKLEAKRGEGSYIELVLIRDGLVWMAPSSFQFRFIVKRAGVFDPEETLALADTFTADTARSLYTARINYATTKLNELLRIDNEPQNEVIEELWAELAYRPTSSVPWEHRSQTVQFVLHNNVWRGSEVVPGSPDPEEVGLPPLLVPHTVVLMAPVTIVNSLANVQQNIPGLKFPMIAGKRYHFRFVVLYSAAATTTGSRWMLYGPTASQLNAVTRNTLTATTETVNHVSAYLQPANCNLTSMLVGNVAVSEGVITATASGDLEMYAASRVGGSAITALAGSFVTYMELPVP